MLYIMKIEEFILEDGMTSATGGAPSTGMGAVVSAQPSGLAGTTIGTNWASGGGTEGSGDIGVPYNPSGANRMFQKMPVMGFEHGARTGKKSRNKNKKPFPMKRVPEKPSKILSYQDYLKNDISTIKKD
jgi:hypothetical protein